MQKVSVMGILNVTPDSFSDGGLFNDVSSAVTHAKAMLDDGADIIDIGGESSRPGSTPVSVEEELQRVLPVIEAVRSLPHNFQISIDTYKAAVAKEALAHGATIVNSMGGFQLDPELAGVVAQAQCQVVIYHIKGKPETMQSGKIVYQNVVEEIDDFFKQQILFGLSKGVLEKHFILDPGIGFGKTVKHNLDIVKRLHEFLHFQMPVLIGVSRKSHLATILKEKLHLDTLPGPLERLEASLAETAIAIENGATMVRTHDVLPTKKFLAILEELL